MIILEGSSPKPVYLTVFDDGSMELVLANGDLLAIPVADEEPRRVIQRTSTESSPRSATNPANRPGSSSAPEELAT